MKVFVARHCATEYNEKKLYCGRRDIPLSPKGRAEAVSLAEKLKNYAFDLVISSPLLRAKETAEEIVRGRGIPVLCDGRLIERDFGELEGTDFYREDALVYRDEFACRCKGGESDLDVVARVYAFLEDLKKERGRGNVLLVTHGIVSRVIRTYFCDMTDEEFHAYLLHNGEIAEYEI